MQRPSPLRWALLGATALLVAACGDDGSSAPGGAGGNTTGGTGGNTAGGTGGNTGGTGGSTTGGTGGNTTGGTGGNTTGGTGGTAGSLGDPVSGQYHLGPVEWEGSFWNSCAPYPTSIQTSEGSMLAGVGLSYNGEGQLCDACILVETAAGRSAVLRVVTTGQTNDPGDIDVSSAAYAELDTGEYPRAMTWRLVPCPATGPVYYQFQTGAHAWWSSFWVRNARLPIGTVEVLSTNHASFTALRRGPDGTWNDDGGFGEGAFTLRVTALSGEVLEDEFPSFVGGDLLASPSGQFP